MQFEIRPINKGAEEVVNGRRFDTFGGAFDTVDLRMLTERLPVSVEVSIVRQLRAW